MRMLLVTDVPEYTWSLQSNWRCG